MSLRSIVITDPVYADRINELQQGALQRTGGHKPLQDWRSALKLSQEHPNLSCIVGLFQGEETTPENMGAFGWGLNHGDYVEQRAAGSTRQTDARIPYGYLVVWNLVQWAKSVGVQWFDMGGVTVAEGDENHLEGISRFKKYFSREVLEVGAEWILEPAPLRAKVATAISKGTDRVRVWKARKG
jgi:lipid II:glycine glycyltransferase (peptidoglycan interpeptide bridge formation enzyme)